ncbi:MAG: alpha/beta hydrolase [Anaerolineales bacterium]|nr:alpha/beta hydrolase [Anaerolineales bacterium]
MKQKSRGFRYWVNLFLAGIMFILLGFIGLIINISYKQTQSYLHPARHHVTGEFLKTNNIQYQNIELTTEDGIKLAAWYTPPKLALSGAEGNGVVILVAHGHADARPADMYALFANHGYGVLAWDFRAHGDSEGDFTSLGYYEVLDVKAALDYALAQPDVKLVGGWGGSMGAVTMIRSAAKYPEIEAIVADSPFSTLEDEFYHRVPFPVLRPLIRFFAESQTGLNLNDVSPVDDVALISPRPVFIIQGMEDGMVPLDSAQLIYDAAGEPKQLWVEPDAIHLGMYSSYPEEYTEKVIGFFEKYLAGK